MINMKSSLLATCAVTSGGDFLFVCLFVGNPLEFSLSSKSLFVDHKKERKQQQQPQREHLNKNIRNVENVKVVALSGRAGVTRGRRELYSSVFIIII